VSDFIKFFDKTAFLVLLLIIIMGALLVFSATSENNNNYFFKHLIKIIISLVLFSIVFLVKMETINRWSFAAYFVLVLVLFIQLFTGKIISGTKSWIKMGVLSIQVSEFVKIPLALILARVLSRVSILDWKSFLKVAAFVMGPFVLIALQPDMGTAFILVSFIAFAILLKKTRLSIVIISLLIITAGSFLMWNYMLKPYQKERIISFCSSASFEMISRSQRRVHTMKKDCRPYTSTITAWDQNRGDMPKEKPEAKPAIRSLAEKSFLFEEITR